MDSAVSSTTPYYNRFSCCHGADDAYARIYGYFKRQLARVSVRAAMLVRLRALDVVLGRSPRPDVLAGVVDGPQGGEARKGDASGGCPRRE